MIKIIKSGKTDFRMTCDKCGCIFEYNVADIDDGYIKCPTCGKKHCGFGPDYELNDEPTYQSLNECEGCPIYKQLRLPNIYVGDLPCQWCSKNPWKVTCNTATYTTSTNATAFSEITEDMEIACKAEGVEYTTTLEDYPERSYTAELSAEPNYYTANSVAAGGTYSYSEIKTYIPDTYGACCSCSCEKASRESKRSCEAEAEPTPGKCDCFSKLDKKATKKRKAAK